MTTITGWYDPAPKGGHLRLAAHSYLAAAGDATVRMPGLRRGDHVTLADGRVMAVNGTPPPSAGLAERPEEVSDLVDWGRGEVIASSFDLSHERHVAVAEMVFEHARRQVEVGRDVVIVLESLTRLARSHNTAGKSSRRTLTGGLDANALAKPKALFGAARSVPDGGSLTIIATALVETESRMDDVIFEEFKGTGNAELRLVRELADRRIYPAVDVAASGTRREELLADAATVAARQVLRRSLVGLPPDQAMSGLLTQIRRTATNADLLRQFAASTTRL